MVGETNMNDSIQQEEKNNPDNLPFVAPCNTLPIFAAKDWLTLGWEDYKKAKKLSLISGASFIVASYIFTFLSWKWGGAVLLFSLLSGFVFVAPILALGLYSISCQLSSGFEPKFMYSFREGKRHMGNVAVFSLLLLIILLVWVRAGSAIHIFFPMSEDPRLSEMVTFFTVGSAVGSIFAFVVFCTAAFSLPMMMDRKADAITAVLSSVNAVKKNKVACLIWVGVIFIFTLLNIVTGFLSMVITMPLLGYATWHGYKQTIVSEQWPKNRKYNDGNPGK